jgi:hypothetical protein
LRARGDTVRQIRRGPFTSSDTVRGEWMNFAHLGERMPPPRVNDFQCLFGSPCRRNGRFSFLSPPPRCPDMGCRKGSVRQSPREHSRSTNTLYHCKSTTNVRQTGAAHSYPECLRAASPWIRLREKSLRACTMSIEPPRSQSANLQTLARRIIQAPSGLGGCSGRRGTGQVYQDRFDVVVRERPGMS